ncbi:MAG: radical SAM protein [Planctomycetes bacterium]|nr:radical SAM protein [Planctomycetota bacterium]
MGVAELAASRLDWAAAQLADCRLCPRQCRANRAAGGLGFCGAGAEARRFMDYVHYGEEAELVPSHSVFLTGCNLRCLFCHTAIERRTLPAEPLTAGRLRATVERGRREGARNVSFHGGEPTVNAPALLRLFAEMAGTCHEIAQHTRKRPCHSERSPSTSLRAGSAKSRNLSGEQTDVTRVTPLAGANSSERCFDRLSMTSGERVRLPPIVWNTNLYCTAETLEAIAGIPAVYLVDLKFGNGACAAAVAGAADYWEVVRARLKETAASESGKLIVRHLVLPGHLDCCTWPALEWLARELPSARLSLKTDYLAMPDARGDKRLGRFLTDGEVREAAAIAKDLGIPLAAGPDLSVPRLARPAVSSAARSDEPTVAPAEPLDAELVISPKGAVFLHHPTRDITSVALAVSHRGRVEDEDEGRGRGRLKSYDPATGSCTR